MNRVLSLVRAVPPEPEPDAELLDRFRDARDDAAFAELVRRYGPLVWGACRRRLPNRHDAEDAFQATFLVLVRRAHRLHAAPLGPWLYKVALMVAANASRANRRRAAVNGPMEHEVPAPSEFPDAKLDIDAALMALPERDREPVVLCHLQGLSRREAAERLGCPEGTLSARLGRALARLRARLGTGAPALLAGAAVAVPNELAAATVRAAEILSASAVVAAGVSPVVAGLTNGVLRMFWLKKAVAAVAVAVLMLGAGGLALFTTESGATARAEPPLREQPIDLDPLRRLDKELADLEARQKELSKSLDALRAEREKLEALQRAKKDADEAAALGTDIEVAVGASDWPRPNLVREVVKGKVSEMTCSSLELLTLYLSRANADPKGPKKLRVSAYKDHALDELKPVFAACAAAGFKTANFSTVERPKVKYQTRAVVNEAFFRSRLEYAPLPAAPQPGELDLTKFAPKK
jgi:RNA polymerase sigma factor (sigma-70 family)